MLQDKRRPKGEGSIIERWTFVANLGEGAEGKRVRKTLSAKKRKKLVERIEGEGLREQDGSIRHRFAFVADLGKGSKGKRVRRTVYATTRAALLRKVADLRARSGGALQPKATGTVAEWVERWLRDDVQPNRSPNTYGIYELVWRRHAAPAIGHVPLERFDIEHVEQLYAHLRRSGVSDAMMQKVAMVMQRAIAVAIRRRTYHRANPFTVVEKPRYVAKETRILTVLEARRFLDAATGTRYEALWVLLLTSGLRLGEALGLEWRDVDFDRRTLSVRQALLDVGGHTAIGPLKTRGSRRLVDLGELALDALRRHREAAEREGHGSEFIFTTSTGSHPRRANLRQREFDPICERAKIAGLTIHGLRHSMTSLALAQGIQPKVLAERLGHSTTRLTEDRYGHVLPGLQREAAASLDALLTRPRKRK